MGHGAPRTEPQSTNGAHTGNRCRASTSSSTVGGKAVADRRAQRPPFPGRTAMRRFALRLLMGPSLAIPSPPLRRVGGRRLWPGAAGLHLSAPAAALRLHLPGPTAADGLYGRCANGAGQWPQRRCCCTARIFVTRAGSRTIAALSDKAGYRVVAPDQIGFCASTKPAHYQYSFQQLATQHFIRSLTQPRRPRNRP